MLITGVVWEEENYGGSGIDDYAQAAAERYSPLIVTFHPTALFALCKMSFSIFLVGHWP